MHKFKHINYSHIYNNTNISYDSNYDIITIIALIFFILGGMCILYIFLRCFSFILHSPLPEED